MIDKIKITRKEIEDMYDITDDTSLPAIDTEPKGEEMEKNFTFEEYSEHVDNKLKRDFQDAD